MKFINDIRMKIDTADQRRLVHNLYQGLLHRDPEEGALDHWVAQLAGGADVNDVIQQFLQSDEYKRLRNNSNRLFVPPGHFYSPIVNTAEVREAFTAPRAVPQALPGIEIDQGAMTALWRELLPFLQALPFPDEQAEGFRYFFRNTAFSYGDGSILSAMLQRFRPRRLVEVGSGYSSACAMDTIERFVDGEVDVSFVEPYPELLIKLLGPDTAKRVRIDAVGVQKADPALFGQLQAGDFLFIDSTHVMKTGSDVCHELFEVLPALKPGVFVHFHDIFWPFEYGAEWVLQENRSWNEIYGLRAFLMYNTAFEVVFFNDYFVKHCREAVETGYPAMLRNSGGSIWLRRK